ncbi:serine/arginine repetitive matrix protein 1 isoform X2 [Uranotaenia lowii]|uniref:serine/arginine repetitive matrix protein 1 isoform X2 n=1 Tax=Uranotaenia lowii TaxID=190385 RepID=UPI002479F66B|nr:serine/arginine repetitive matrix protein 1 isoform X2 [Uranotaenia lowii]
MIGSFWNLCRACPSMPVDKLHSEYRSTYRWHEYTGGPEVVRKPPVPNQFASSKVDHFFSKSTEDDKFIEASINEPPLPRRKKCPELAYRTHEFLSGSRGGQEPLSASTGGHDRPDAATTHSRARSGERGTPSRRSKSEGPPGVANGRLPTGTGLANGTVHHEPVPVEGKAKEQAGESSGLFKQTISKLSTEYRLQFVWPNVRRAIKGAGKESAIEPPRKSLSMGAIKAAQAAHAHAHAQSQTVPTVHKKRTTNEREANAHELEPLVNDAGDDKPHHEKRDLGPAMEHKLRAYKTEKESFGFAPEAGAGGQNRGTGPSDSAWYKEVLELRKKAGEYRNRGWGVEMNQDMLNKQQELWEQVSRRSSLSALSLASSIRPITKEEKDKQNNLKSSPTKPHARKIPGSARPVERQLPDGLNINRNFRHHLERTTGMDVEEGALLPSPTREKLMPAIPRSKGDSPQRGSPQKTALSRHGSPQKGSPQKSSPKKMSSKGRSQSVGPAVATDSSVASVGGGSPKRQIRSGSTVTASTAASAAKAHNKKPATATTPSQSERRPRPTTLYQPNTTKSTSTNHSRSKSSTLPHSRVHSAPPSRSQVSHQINKDIKNNNNINNTNNNSNLFTNTANKNNNNISNNNNNHLPNNQQKTPKPPTTLLLPDSANNNISTVLAPTITTTTTIDSTTSTITTSSHPSRAKLTLGTKIGSQNRPRAVAPNSSTGGTPASSSANSSGCSTLKKDASRKMAAANSKSLTDSGRKTKLAAAAGNEEDADKDGGISAASVSPLPAPEITEQIIKSPPEPTRVKSPEQIIMRSPDPVNWTVPLDTGKTFTVTQNVREGDPMIRPHSEIKVSTPVDPPPAPQSAPPELSEQSKLPSNKLEPDSIKESEDEDDEDQPKSKSSVTSSANPTTVTSAGIPAVAHTVTTKPETAPLAASTTTTTNTAAAAPVPVAAPISAPAAAAAPVASAPAAEVRFDKPVPGSTLRCLEDPTFDTDINSPLGSRSVVTDVLDKARDRFDRFWGNPDGAKPDEA